METLIVVLILAAAAAFLGWRLWKVFSGAASSAGGGCACSGCGQAGKDCAGRRQDRGPR